MEEAFNSFNERENLNQDAQNLGEKELTKEEIANGLSCLARCANEQFAFTQLDVANLSLSDISSLRSYQHIQTLNISHNNLTTLSCLASLPYLSSLNASHNKLTKILDFSSVFNLREADLSHNNISIMNDISNHRYLTSLNLRGNQIRYIAGISNLVCLKKLILSENLIRHISGVAGLGLKELHLAGNDLTKIENMHQLPRLQILILDRNQIQSLDGTESLLALMELSISFNKINLLGDMEALRNLPLLSHLNIVGNEITAMQCYRLRILHIVPDLDHLDGVDVCAEEKISSVNFHDTNHPQYEDLQREDSQDLPPSLFLPHPLAHGENSDIASKKD